MRAFFHKKTVRGFSRIIGLVGLCLISLLAIGCGDVYRPVATIIPQQPPNPAASHFVIAATANGTGQGAGSYYNVSGDTTSGVFQTGVSPMHAAMTGNGSRVYVANFGDDTVTQSTVSTPTTATAVSLASGTHPVFVHSTETGNMYVANFGNNTVSVINTTSNVVTTSVPVGTNPVALAEMPNAQKLYVANEGSNNVTVINIFDDSVGSTIGFGAAPVWEVARTDNARIYVLDASGLISAIDTATDTIKSNSVAASAGAGANFLFLDSKAQRLYVTNPVAHTLSLFDILEANPAVPVNTVATLDLSQGTNPAYVPVSVTGIGDGSRAYVASYQLTTCTPPSGNYTCINTVVDVIDVGSNIISKVIPVASGIPVDTGNSDGCGGTANPTTAPWTPPTDRFRLSTTASGGGSTSNFKVYVGQCDAQNVAVIDTFAANSNPADTFTGVTLPTPLSSIAPQQLSISAATQDSATGTTTFNYILTSGSGLKAGMNIFITGMSNSGNNGNFVISAPPTATTFTVANPSGVTASSQSGTGAVLPRQNPVFLVAGP